jgi:hypothetical protein
MENLLVSVSLNSTDVFFKSLSGWQNFLCKVMGSVWKKKA